MAVCPEYYSLEQRVLADILSNYKNYPCLWDPTQKCYKNKNMKEQAWQALTDKWKTVDSSATVDSFKRKLDNMRSTFNREWKKVECGKTSGDEDDKYIPMLWYYNYLTFLHEEQKVYQPLKRPVIDLVKDDDDEPEKEKKVKINNSKEHPSDLQEKQEHLIDPVLNVFAGEDNSSDSFVRAMGHQLKEMSKRQRCIAENLISEVMFYGKLGQLTLESNVNLGSDRSDCHLVPSLSCYNKPINYSP